MDMEWNALLKLRSRACHPAFSLFITRCRTKDTGTRLSVHPCDSTAF